MQKLCSNNLMDSIYIIPPTNRMKRTRWGPWARLRAAQCWGFPVLYWISPGFHPLMCTRFRLFNVLQIPFFLGTHCACAGCAPQHRQWEFSQLLGKEQPWLYSMATWAGLRSCQHFLEMLERLRSAQCSNWWILLLLLTLSPYGLGSVPPNLVNAPTRLKERHPTMNNITLTAKDAWYNCQLLHSMKCCSFHKQQDNSPDKIMPILFIVGWSRDVRGPYAALTRCSLVRVCRENALRAGKFRSSV